MSTIVFRDGIMAADSRAYSGGATPIGRKVKVRRVGEQLVGITTTKVGTDGRLLEWLVQGGDPPADVDDFSMLLVNKDGSALLYEDSCYPSGPIQAPFYAVGSGRQYALGAMQFGACAVDALRVACKLDVWSALPIDCVKHDGLTWRVEA